MDIPCIKRLLVKVSKIDFLEDKISLAQNNTVLSTRTIHCLDAWAALQKFHFIEDELKYLIEYELYSNRN